VTAAWLQAANETIGARGRPASHVTTPSSTHAIDGGVISAAALIFDMDGLLIDSEPLWFEVERDFVRARGGEWTRELADACVGQGLARTLAVMGEACGIVTDAARDAEHVVESFLARVGELALKPGCREMVDAAFGAVPMAVASSSSRRLVDASLARFDLAPKFGAVVSGEHVARPKPAPDIFLEAASRLGIAPGMCVVLEDSRAGVRAARAAGMRVVAVPERDAADFEGTADAVVGNLHEARALLRW
jgi:sugar-phosphatase